MLKQRSSHIKEALRFLARLVRSRRLHLRKAREQSLALRSNSLDLAQGSDCDSYADYGLQNDDLWKLTSLADPVGSAESPGPTAGHQPSDTTAHGAAPRDTTSSGVGIALSAMPGPREHSHAVNVAVVSQDAD